MEFNKFLNLLYCLSTPTHKLGGLVAGSDIWVNCSLLTVEQGDLYYGIDFQLIHLDLMTNAGPLYVFDVAFVIR